MNLTAPPVSHRINVPVNFHKGARPSWHQRRRHRCLLGLLARAGGTEVLDYGCGYGDLSHAIARTHSVRGVDVDPGRVAFAAAEYAPLEFSVCRPEGLDFPDASFDVVVSSVVLPFVPDPVGYLRECRRVLRDGGRLILATRDFNHVRDFFRRLLGRGPSPVRLWVRPRSEIRRLLEQEGFSIVEQTYFYDPPFDAGYSPSAVGLGLIEQVLAALRVEAASGYFAFLATKNATGAQEGHDAAPARSAITA